MNVSSNLFPGLSIHIGDVLVRLPHGFLGVAANVRTGTVYSMPVLSFLPQNFIVEEGGLNAFAFSIDSFQDGGETRSPPINLRRLSETCVAALREYVRNHALALFDVLGFPQAFYIVVGFQRQENTFTRVSGIVVRMQVPANEIEDAAAANFLLLFVSVVDSTDANGRLKALVIPLKKSPF
ncbi:hypothetical protein ONZ45_g2599 [Pleurotus djamor]|nr:hypothetical protein ONZ45_g2599 [Pleurotus djamor]